ncbi:MAG: hypothetical protein KBE09_03920 [Candidatus Pacebacteria bacterium]|nr:hypothetical protein [Candidatus Paceibacterota bacterium]
MTTTCPDNAEVKAEVTGFHTAHGDHIAFASTEQHGTVTFKISSDVWSGSRPPAKGEIVMLSKLSRFRKGWRASSARRFVLTDES